MSSNIPEQPIVVRSSPGLDPPADLAANQRRTDLLIFAVIVLVSLILRSWNFPALALDHFDEGVYTLSGFWSVDPFHAATLYPLQKLFSPPGYLGLVGLAYLVAGGASDLAALAINMLFGAATVALAGWIGRRWFGRSCGFAAAILVACNTFHIAFSRTALTDVVFGFFFLLSLALSAISLADQKISWAVLAGLAAGAAWNTKYHGWMPVALVLLVIAVEAVTSRQDRANVKRAVLLWLITASVAVVCFLPWVSYTELHLGGYLAVERFHRQFLDFHWADNFVRQAQMQLYFDGWLSRLSPAIAFLTALAASGNRAWRRWRIVIPALAAVLFGGLVIGGVSTTLALALFALPSAWKRGGHLGRLIACAMAALFVLVPCYTPYARLLLPWLLFVQILASIGIMRIAQMDEQVAAQSAEHTFRMERRLGWGLGATVLILCVMYAFGIRPGPGPRTWSARDTVREAVAEMTEMIPLDSVVFVDSEPDAAFYFRRAGYHTFCINRLSGNVLTPDPLTYSGTAPVYLVGGLYARQQPDWNPIPPEFLAHLEALRAFRVRPSDVRLLDDFPPQEVLEYRVHPDSRYDLFLFRVKSATTQIP